MKNQSFRCPHTTQEIKSNIALLTDNEIIEVTGRRILVRPKRVNLPTDRTDKQHSTKYNDNTWKRHREYQYRDRSYSYRINWSEEYSHTYRLTFILGTDIYGI